MASCLAIDPGNPTRVIGAALLAPVQGYDLHTTNEAPIELQLQPVFVVPDWQRKRVATALVCELISRLWKAGHGVLRSGCSDYNTVSKKWHLAFGVTEELRYFARRPIFYWLRSEIWRKEYLWETQRIRFEPDEKLRLERWLMALGAELDELEEAYYGISSGGRGCNRYREEVRRLIGRRQER
jgi:GNAT superfamily N-acetyltransferase